MEQRVWQYFEAGTREVWVVHPEQRAVVVRTPDGGAERLEAGAVLVGGTVVSGFACPVGEGFAG